MANDVQQLKLQAKGLFTHPNPLSEVPEGALNEATNVVIDREGIVESRRGQKQYRDSLLGYKQIGLFEYQGYLFQQTYDGSIKIDDQVDPDWRTFIGLIKGPEENNYVSYTAQANKNLYLTGLYGIYKLDKYSNLQFELAGGPKGLDGSGSVVVPTGTGFMSTNTNVAYRIVWGRNDQNQNLILGAPSQRIIVSNTSGSNRDVSLTFTLPDDVVYYTTINRSFYQVYRSGASATASDEPNDEMYLVYEEMVEPTDITNGYITITDITPDELRGATLYTSPSQEGIQNSNEQPPWASDIASYKNHLLYANTKRKNSLTTTLITVGGSFGLVLDSTVTVSGVVYTAKAAENIAARQFQLFTAGTPAENIEKTAQSLIRVNNRYNLSVSYMYYESGYDDLPGKIRVEAKNFTTSASIQTSKPNAWNPTLNGTLDGTFESKPNRVYVSKIQQPESVPLYRYLDVGTSDNAIKRIVGLRDSVIVFKDDGVFRISGEQFENMTVTLLDGTTRLKANGSVAAFNNQVVCYSDQGVVAVSESSVQVLSRPIENSLLSLSSNLYDHLFPKYTFGVGYESARKYILYTITDLDSEGADQAFVLNTATNSWTRWLPPEGETWSCALVAKRDDLLYVCEYDEFVGVTQNGTVTQERKTLTLGDYVEKEFNIDIDTIEDNHTLTYTKLFKYPHPKVGWGIQQGTRRATITSVTETSTTSGSITVNPGFSGWEVDEATYYQSIYSTIRTTPIHGGNPGILKQFREMTLFFNDAKFTTMECSVRNPITDVEQTITLTPVMGGAWGLFGWGTRPWGGGFGGQQPIRVLIPAAVNRTNWIDVRLTSNEAFTSFQMGGMSLIFTPMSSRMK